MAQAVGQQWVHFRNILHQHASGFQAVENLFSIIQQLNQRSLDYGRTIKEVDQSSIEMHQTVSVLHASAETVRLNANKLQKLVGLFEVTRASGQRKAA